MANLPSRITLPPKASVSPEIFFTGKIIAPIVNIKTAQKNHVKIFNGLSATASRP